MRVIVSGFSGKMGKLLVGEIDQTTGVELVGGFDKVSEYTGSTSFDVLIDFSHPSEITNILDFCIKYQKPCVIATTGFSSEQRTIIEQASVQIPIFQSANFSYGVYALNEILKKALSLLDGYDIEIIEKHHNQKQDAPSGTAKMLFHTIQETRTDSEMVSTYQEKRKDYEVGVHSLRLGTINGEHEVLFATNDEIISIKHEALSKRIFTVGALKAAKWLVSQPSGLYQMKDLGEV